MSAAYYNKEHLSSPQVYLVRVLVFLAVIISLLVILSSHIYRSFLYNPAINSLIIGCTVIGIALASGQIFRLFPEVRWVNRFMKQDEQDLAEARDPVLLAPMATLLNTRQEGASLSTAIMRSILDSLASRFDESRELLRYMTGLLVFLGLLGTFWGLTTTVGSVSSVVGSLDVSGTGDPADSLSRMTAGIGSAVGGMGTAFSSSLFGLVGSLILGFISLQTGQAQGRFYHELEEWLSAMTGTEAGDQMPLIRPSYSSLPFREIANSLDRLSERTAQQGLSKTKEIDTLAHTMNKLVYALEQDQKDQKEWREQIARHQSDLTRTLSDLNRILNDLKS